MIISPDSSLSATPSDLMMTSMAPYRNTFSSSDGSSIIEPLFSSNLDCHLCILPHTSFQSVWGVDLHRLSCAGNRTSVGWSSVV